jgi:glycosyltransferase involved in cell wall biosynthesis
MKIAFDGTVLHGRKSGVGYYCEELLKAMVAMNHKDQFFVFSHKKLDLSLPASNGNLKVANASTFPVRAFYLHALLPSVLEQIQPDLCHYTNFLAPILQTQPYVVTIHDMGLEVMSRAHPLMKRLYTRRLIPRVARQARLVITNSEYSKWEIVRHLGISEDRIRVTPLAAAQEFRPTPSTQELNPYFLYVGNLEPRKNLDRLIEAFARVSQKDIELLIVGDRWYRGGEAEKKVRSLGLAGRVRFLGYVPRAELPALYSGATAFVYPSLLEGFGLPVVEAMACGAPVITSNNSALKEIAGGASLLVDPRNVQEMTEALSNVAGDKTLREKLSSAGLQRAARFSWENTARLTLDAYQEAVKASTFTATISVPSTNLADAICRTVEYGKLFQYPLTRSELRERLFSTQVDEGTFEATMKSFRYEPDAELVAVRAEREQITDQAIREVQPHLRTLASMPFVRMIAFSGSTAHRNMTTTADVDLFLITEDGKLWATFLAAMVWAKRKGLRKILCMNYMISDAALPLFEHDAFTAQQVASLKPIYGKKTYDRFIAANPFVARWFPNFDPALHREAYQEIPEGNLKARLEAFLRIGIVQVFERFSRFVLGRHLSKKINPSSDVQLDRRHLKLHFQSHKKTVLDATFRSAFSRSNPE